MGDNDVIKLFLPIITAGLVADGYSGIVVQQSNQPTQQGIPTAPTVYFYKLANKRYGYLGRQDVWDPIGSAMVHTETQYVESTFTVSALVLQVPASTTTTYTASDLVNDVASILQSDSTIVTLNNSGIGILRVSDIRNPYFVDDRDQFEASPSFDFTLVYAQARVSTNPVIESYEYGIKRV
jgi:hypothetical protein